jgi:hypothetical protein
MKTRLPTAKLELAGGTAQSVPAPREHLNYSSLDRPAGLISYDANDNPLGWKGVLRSGLYCEREQQTEHEGPSRVQP